MSAMLKRFALVTIVGAVIGCVGAAANVAAIRVALVFESRGQFMSGCLVTAGNVGDVYPGVPTCF